jgi:membrane-bound lytic murein transglycosylase F
MRVKLIFILFVIFFTGCIKEKPQTKTKQSEVVQNIVYYSDLAQIQQRDTLIALTGYNAYSYFIYRGQPMGYEYELLNLYAKHLGVKLKIKVLRNITEMFRLLNQGKGDLIAYNLTVTGNRKKEAAFTVPLNTSKQVLVQRRPAGWERMTLDQTRENLIKSPIELIGKEVWVRNGSVYIQRLKHLSEEIGGEIFIKVAPPEETTEDLIKKVSDGEIDYTVADENIARLNQAYYRNIDFSVALSLPQQIAWAVRKTSVDLLRDLNNWISREKRRTDYYVIYDRYYKNRLAFRRRLRSEYFSHTGGKISKYDDLIKKYASQLNWDWRILAALIYRESQFNPKAKSWAGARGLMQLMPVVAKKYGVKNLNNPVQNLKAGMKYIKWLDKYWSKYITDKTERIKFVLASYNIGYGHIQDARRLAEKYGANPNIWENNVEVFLLKKSNPKYYNDKSVRNGFASGKETVNYVNDIFNFYQTYKKFIS